MTYSAVSHLTEQKMPQEKSTGRNLATKNYNWYRKVGLNTWEIKDKIVFKYLFILMQFYKITLLTFIERDDISCYIYLVNISKPNALCLSK